MVPGIGIRLVRPAQASIVVSLFSSAPKYQGEFAIVRFIVSLSAPANSTLAVSVSRTNENNTGNVSDTIVVNQGSTSGEISVTYLRLASQYLAMCSFSGDLPSGYVRQGFSASTYIWP